MPLDGVKNVVLVLSGKGGVGKSSVTLQLALALSLQGKSVGILDIDLTGPSIPRLVGLEDAKITQAPGGWLPVPVHSAVEALSTTSTTSTSTSTSTGASTTTPSDQQPQPQPQSQEQQEQQETQPSTSHTSSPIPRGALHCMSLGFLLRSRSDAVIWRGPKKTAMIRQFLSDVLWGETDYLLIDTPPGTSDEHIALAEQLLTLCMTSPPAAADASAGKMPRLAGAVLVTTPQAIATSDVRKEVNFCVKTNIPTLGVIENMSGYTCPCCGEVTNLFSSGGGEVMAREMGVRFLGSVPVDVGFGALVEGKGIGDEGEGTSDDDEEEEEEEEEGEGMYGARRENGDGTAVEEDDRLLVERYREGWSYARFEGFAKTLISETEGSSDA